MTERIDTAHRQNQRRMAFSIAIALFIHAGIFVTFQYGIRPHPEELPEYSGPITVTLYESTEQMRATEAQAAVQKAVVQPEKVPEIRHESVQKTPDAVRKTEKRTEPLQKSTQPYESGTAKAPEDILAKPRETAGPLPVPVQERRLGAEGPVEESLNVPSGGIQAPTRGLSPREVKPSQQAAPSTQTAGTAASGTIPAATGEKPVSEEAPKPKFSFPPVEQEEKPLSLDMNRLEQALEKTTTATTEETQQKTTATEPGTSSTGAPSIEWEDARRGRTLLSSPALPVIPEWVKREGLNLSVMVSFEVTPQGHTTTLNVKQSSGYSDVDSAVLEAVRKLRFNPIADNRNVRGVIRYIISAR